MLRRSVLAEKGVGVKRGRGRKDWNLLYACMKLSGNNKKGAWYREEAAKQCSMHMYPTGESQNTRITDRAKRRHRYTCIHS